MTRDLYLGLEPASAESASGVSVCASAPENQRVATRCFDAAGSRPNDSQPIPCARIRLFADGVAGAGSSIRGSGRSTHANARCGADAATSIRIDRQH